MKKKNRDQGSGWLGGLSKFMGLDEEDDYEYYDEEESEQEETGRKDKTGPQFYKEPGRRGNLRLLKDSDAEERAREVWKEEEDDFEEEENERPWVSGLTFLGLAVLAAIICAILWYFTHPDKPEAGGQDAPPGSAAVQDPGVGSGESEGPEENLEDISDQNPEGEPVSGSESIGEENPDGAWSSDAQTSDGGTEIRPGQDDVSDAETGSSEEIDSSENIQEPEAGTTAMRFDEQKESVTPKDVVNLRSVPSTADDNSIVVQCKNGEVFTRTGINKDTGWSRVEYGGETLYAVTQYLSANLDYKPQVQVSDPNRVATASGRVVIFTNCDDWISPKEYVNLRTEPSTDGGNDTVSCQLNYGKKAHRTGYSTDSGWSRVEYDGQVLYVVTSLMYEVDPE